jgi:hypothetical protein
VSTLDRAGIAERLRELILRQESGDITQTAAQLGVEELSLRMSIDPDSPHPTIEVLAAAIGYYGLDPTWLLTGVYNSRTHRDAVENEEKTRSLLREHVTSGRPRISIRRTNPSDAPI